MFTYIQINFNWANNIINTSTMIIVLMKTNKMSNCLPLFVLEDMLSFKYVFILHRKCPIENRPV